MCSYIYSVYDMSIFTLCVFNILCTERHGIHQQKDLSKFYSNLLKNNISMGAYNVKASDNTSNEDSKQTAALSNDQARDEEGTIKEKKHDDDNTVEQKKDDTRRPRDEDNEERSDTETEEMNREPIKVKDDHEVMEDTSVKEEKTIKKKAEKRNTDETVMAARERYLARKRMKLQSTQ